MDLEIGRLEARIDTLEIKINVDTKASKARFDPNVSIIILGLPEEEEEDIQMKVQQLVIKGLGSEAVPIAVERMRAYGRAPGVVKAEFRSVHEKVSILYSILLYTATTRATGVQQSVYTLGEVSY